MESSDWQLIGNVDTLKQKELQTIHIGRKKIALSYLNGAFAAISGVCNHVGGPLGDGKLDGCYVVCPWHNWKFHHKTGEGEPGFEADKVPAYTLKTEDGNLYIDLNSATKRGHLPHKPHPLSRKIGEREPGPIRVLGISTTAMDARFPRYSTSDDLLELALDHAREAKGADTQLIKLNDLKFRACEGYYSKSAHACTWPCSITQMDSKDELDRVYEGIVFWADVILLSSPIRWGNASSLYYKMIERMNCIQNQITIKNRVMLNNKVAAFIITGGQDNIQSVAGQMQMFFGELGCMFPQFPFIAHSRGWSHEDMENNMAYVQRNQELREGAKELVERSIATAKQLLETGTEPPPQSRGGRKACGSCESDPGRETAH